MTTIQDGLAGRFPGLAEFCHTGRSKTKKFYKTEDGRRKHARLFTLASSKRTQKLRAAIKVD
jgi:hypothetical protein